MSPISTRNAPARRHSRRAAGDRCDGGPGKCTSGLGLGSLSGRLPGLPFSLMFEGSQSVSPAQTECLSQLEVGIQPRAASCVSQSILDRAEATRADARVQQFQL